MYCGQIFATTFNEDGINPLDYKLFIFTISCPIGMEMTSSDVGRFGCSLFLSIIVLSDVQLLNISR